MDIDGYIPKSSEKFLDPTCDKLPAPKGLSEINSDRTFWEMTWYCSNSFQRFMTDICKSYYSFYNLRKKNISARLKYSLFFHLQCEEGKHESVSQM